MKCKRNEKKHTSEEAVGSVGATLTFVWIGEVKVVVVVVEQDGGDRVFVHFRVLDVVRVDETDGGAPQEVHLFLRY